MRHFVIIERTDKHGSRDGRPTLQWVSGKGAALDLVEFAARNSEQGAHLWWFTDETAARKFYNDRRVAGASVI